MRTVLASTATLLLLATPAFAQLPAAADQSNAQQQPGAVPNAGGGQGSGPVFVVPRSMVLPPGGMPPGGLPPGAVVLVPRQGEAEQDGEARPGAAQPANAAQQPSHPAAAARGASPFPGLGVWIRLRHAGDEVEVRCAPGETTQSCIQSAAPLISVFLSSFGRAPGNQASGDQASGSQPQGSQPAGNQPAGSTPGPAPAPSPHTAQP